MKSLRSVFCKGAAAADSCARLRVARANRAVTLFAMLRFVFFAPPFFMVVVVFTPLHSVWCSKGRGGLFCCTRSLFPHSRLFPAPLNPNKVVAALRFFVRGQPPLIVVLACGSLGLIGLSRFLQCSVSFFCPALYYGCGRVHSASLQSHHHDFLTQAREPSFIRSLRFASYTTFTHSSRHTCPARKKNYTARQKSRHPCVFHVGSRSPHFATLHCGLFASATLAPLADGSRLSTPQAKNHSASLR